MPHIMETKGKSEKDRIIYIEDGTPKTYHVIEGDNFTIMCEIRSLLPVKSVRWQRDGCDINSQSPEYKLNDPKISLTIENLSASHNGNYRCLVSNYFGFNNTTVDRCVNYLSALHRRMTWIQTLHQFKACNKEDQNAITINVHSLPTAAEYKLEEKPKGDKVTLTPVSEDIAYVIWFYKTEDILSALKRGQYSYEKDRSVKAEQNEDTKNGAEEAIQLGDSKDGAAKAMHHHDTKDGAVTEQKDDINVGGTPNIHALVFKAAVSDNGQYVCFVVTAMKKIISYGWKLKVILQVRTYEEVLKHRKDISYVKTPTVDKAVECLKNNGYVVIVGRKGTGKSKMCLQLESLFEETDYLPFKVNDILDLREITDMIDDSKSTKILFWLDDSDYSPDSLDKRLSLLPEVSDNSKAKVIFTCTQTGLHLKKNILQKWKLYSDKAMIDLDNEANILPLEVKKEILERLSKSMSVKLDVDLVKTIINTKPFYGFPFVAKKFCSDRKHLKKREKYFTNPPKSLRKEIKDLYISSLERKKQDLMNTYCVLVYISTDKSHCLDSSNFNFARIQQIMKIIYNYTAIESPLDAIAVNDIAESLVGKYLVKSDDHTYKFIHPAVLKAVFLSSEYFTKYIVEEGGKEDIIDYIRSEQYEELEGELVLKLETKTYPALCERLLNLLLERPHFGEKIGDYIYHHFISLHDQNFLKTFFLNLEKYFPLQLVMEKENKILEKYGSIRQKKTKLNKESACVNITDSGKTKTSQSSPLPMIRMFEHLTRSGRDSWIFTVDEASIPDFGILYGLIMACKNNFCNDEDQIKTFEIILAFFRKRCEKKDFQLNLFAPMDIYSNVFCHFLALFCETESCLILEELLKWFPESKLEPTKMFSEKTNKPYKVKNILSESPMKISVYLGKAKLFKLIWQKTNSKEKKRVEDLLKTAEIGMKLSYGSGSSTTEVKSFLNLDKDFSQLVLRGEKDGYTDIMKTLKKM
ncbi:CHL1 [Mytilus coruscus]|uniref:CHL1 n=1 Tax=Mytilus coruscus TaxID=42192 RepID=A0A6J8EYH2_MYTCO|nr:CHL1 [Mytilus coruscus]